MTSADQSPVSAVLPPLARAVMDALPEGVALFDSRGKLLYANAGARRMLDGLEEPGAPSNGGLVSRLEALGARRAPLKSGGQPLGEAVFLTGDGDGAATLAERERRAILDTLSVTHGRLAETARRLGISRTTLWRRLKAYGIR